VPQVSGGAVFSAVSPATAGARAVLLAAVLTLLAFAGAVNAAAGDIGLEVVVGAADTFSVGRWTTVTVSVSNRGGDLLGDVELVTGHGDPLARSLHRVIHRRALQLSRDARKRLQFTVMLESVARQLEARVLRDGEVLARQRVDLRRRVAADALVLVLSRDADLDYLNRQPGHALRVVYPLPERLPGHWRGYDAVRALVLHGVSLERLSDAQYEALQRWLASGGVLVVSGGANQSLLRTPRLARLLPATPAGLLGPLDAAVIGEALGVPLPAGEGVILNRVRRPQGEVLAAVDGVPLVVSRALGRGRVHYLTFDIARRPLQRAVALQALWQRLVPLAPALRPPPAGSAAEHERLLRGLLQREGAGFPGHVSLLYFLALYLAVLATGCRLRGSRPATRRLATAMTLGAPLLFAPVAWWLFGPTLFPKGATAVSAALVEPLGDSGYARVSLDLGLYSNHSRALMLEFEGMQPAFVTQPRQGGPTSDWRVEHTAAGGRIGVTERGSYVLHGVRGEDVIPFGVDLQVARDGDALRVAVTNASGRRLRNLWLLYQGRGHGLGDLAPTQRLRRRLRLGANGVELWPDEPWRVLKPVQQADRRPRRGRDPGVDRLLFAPLLKEGVHSSGPAEAVLIGYASSPLRRAGPSADWRVDGVAGLLARVPITPGAVAVAPRDTLTADERTGRGAR
jgi:hypothetical protein